MISNIIILDSSFQTFYHTGTDTQAKRHTGKHTETDRHTDGHRQAFTQTQDTDT